jgi:hypothetical protein
MMKEEDEEEEKSLTGKIPSSAFPLSLSPRQDHHRQRHCSECMMTDHDEEKKG